MVSFFEKLILVIIKIIKISFIISGVDFGENGEILTPKGLKICTGQIQELVLGGLNQAVAGKLVSSVDILRDSYTGKASSFAFWVIFHGFVVVC